jgi:HEXXH motif-containing protein
MVRMTELARPSGLTGEFKQVIAAQRRRVQSDFMACYLCARRNHSRLLETSGFSSYWRQLSALSPDSIAWVFSLPLVASWCDRWKRLLGSETVADPAGDLQESHLREFGGFILAAAIRENGRAEAPLRLNSHGKLYLSGLGRVLEGPPDLSLAELEARAEPAGLTIKSPQGKEISFPLSEISSDSKTWVDPDGHSAQGFRLRRVPVVSGLFELWNADFCSPPAEGSSLRLESLSSTREQSWITGLEKAWKLVESADPLLADEIRFFLRAIVPLVNPPGRIHTSSSFSELPGIAFLSWSADPIVLAELLVHEYHHSKLNAILAYTDLFEIAPQEPGFYSPWKDSPRPLYGLLHGIYSFTGVARFLLAAQSKASLKMTAVELEILQSRILRTILQLQLALESLTPCAAFTSTGKELLAALSLEIHGFQEVPLGISQESRISVERAVQDHRSRWRERFCNASASL